MALKFDVVGKATCHWCKKECTKSLYSLDGKISVEYCEHCKHCLCFDTKSDGEHIEVCKKCNKRETYHDAEAICPRCGHIEYDSWEIDQDSKEFTCNSCGEKSKMEIDITVSYKIWTEDECTQTT